LGARRWGEGGTGAQIESCAVGEGNGGITVQWGTSKPIWVGRSVFERGGNRKRTQRTCNRDVRSERSR